MKSQITKTMVALSILVASSMAHAADLPAWVCSLNFQGTSKSVQVIVGKSEFNGKGTVSCVSASNTRAEFPIKVTMTSAPIAPRIGLGKMEIYGQALQVTLNDGTPESLLGNYLVLEGRASVIGGAGVIGAVHAGNESLSLNVSLQVVKGFGFDLGFRKMKIEVDADRL